MGLSQKNKKFNSAGEDIEVIKNLVPTSFDTNQDLNRRVHLINLMADLGKVKDVLKENRFKPRNRSS